MPEAATTRLQSDAQALEATADQAIAACGGDAREAVKARMIFWSVRSKRKFRGGICAA
jgi:hypothetical protein